VRNKREQQNLVQFTGEIEVAIAWDVLAVVVFGTSSPALVSSLVTTNRPSLHHPAQQQQKPNNQPQTTAKQTNLSHPPSLTISNNQTNLNEERELFKAC
jgi:hypothetical protein